MTPQQARALVSTIDLKAIGTKVRIQQKWDADTAARAEREYREYLTAALADPAFSAPPSRLADEVWHAHVLDTAKYAADCQRVFGTFLHHVPNYEPYLNQAAAADAALCFNQREGEPRDAALCFNQRAEAPKDAALCFNQRDGQPQDAALCFNQREGEPKQAAFCLSQREALPQNAAFCMAQRAAAPAGEALCFAQRGGQPRAAALCFAQRADAPRAAVTGRTRALRRGRRVRRTRA